MYRLIDPLIKTKFAFSKLAMIIIVIFTFCFLLTGFNGTPLQDCTSLYGYFETDNSNFLTCIMANWKSNEQKILQLSRKLAKTEQQNHQLTKR